MFAMLTWTLLHGNLTCEEDWLFYLCVRSLLGKPPNKGTFDPFTSSGCLMIIVASFQMIPTTKELLLSLAAQESHLLNSGKTDQS